MFFHSHHHNNNAEEDLYGLGPEYFFLNRTPKDKHTVTLLRVAEAMFPLAGLVCRALMRARDASRRWFLSCCGEAQAPSCCRWLLDHFPHGSPTITSGPQGEEALEWRRQGWGKECMAVLTGLCRGGHLDSARRFVDEGAPWGSLLWPRNRAPAVTGDSRCPSAARNTRVSPLPTASTCGETHNSGSASGRGFVFYPLPTCYHKYDDRKAVGSGGDFTVGRLESEFWGDKGIPALLDIVAKRGHLDTLKWAFSRFGGTDESWFLLIRLQFAVKGFQVDTVVWLVNTINSTERLAPRLTEWWWVAPRRASDIRRLIETLPELPFDVGGMGWSAVKCKGSADEIIKVCEWLMQRFPSEKMDFTYSRNCEVLKWALEGVNPSLLEPRLGRILHNVDDVQFAQWLLERTTPTCDDFMSVCTHRKDNVDIAKLVFGRITISSRDILIALYSALGYDNSRIAQWLEECFFSLTKTTPTLSLRKLLEKNEFDVPDVTDFLRCRPLFNWAMQHLGDVGCSIPESEVVDWLQDISASSDPETSHLDRDTRDLAFFMIEKFRPHLGDWFSFPIYLEEAMADDDLLQVKKTVHLAETQVGGLVPSDVLGLLTCTHPSKVVKWLISHFNLEKEMTSKQKGEILTSLISSNKCSCAQWFANKVSGTTEGFSNGVRSIHLLQKTKQPLTSEKRFSSCSRFAP
ncbi:hypothetical protein Pelo_9684 [Pelomyxa schiedti]|nr:hypothetical protein Pelo_9684 [Pelomyxa schiedti]